MAVTIKQVAKMVGVAPATVSLVLNGKQATVGISDATAQRVLAAARELNYRPSHSARSLVMGRTQTLGFLCGDIHTPHFAELSSAMLAEAQRHSQHLLVSLTEWDQEKELAALDSLLERGVDGALVWTNAMTPGDRHHTQLVKDRFPIVVSPGLTDLPGIMSDWSTGIRQAVAHLAERGHRRLGVVVDEAYDPVTSEKGLAAAAACDELGLESVEFPIRIGADEGRRLGRGLARDAKGATAVLGYSDHVAIGLIRGLADGGCRVPDGIAVVGLNGTVYGEYFVPALTSVFQDRREVARRGVEMLLARIEDRGLAPEQIVLPTKLIVRESA